MASGNQKHRSVVCCAKCSDILSRLGVDHKCVRQTNKHTDKRTCSLDTSAFSALEVLDDYLLTYRQTDRQTDRTFFSILHTVRRALETTLSVNVLYSQPSILALNIIEETYKL